MKYVLSACFVLMLFSCKKENVQANNPGDIQIEVQVYAKSNLDSSILATSRTVSMKLK
jgi:hypothetical protein